MLTDFQMTIHRKIVRHDLHISSIKNILFEKTYQKERLIKFVVVLLHRKDEISRFRSGDFRLTKIKK